MKASIKAVKGSEGMFCIQRAGKPLFCPFCPSSQGESVCANWCPFCEIDGHQVTLHCTGNRVIFERISDES